MTTHSRIDEMRRRVEKDPASVTFASLAEELRKAGEHDEAVRVCRAGLERHPAYLSARVTLGRALLELQQYPEARTELEFVLQAAPDNLLALKCMGELEERESALPAAAPPAAAEAIPEPAPLHAAPLPPTPAPEPAAVAEPATVPEPAAVPQPVAAQAPATPAREPPPPNPALGELEGWQARIQADRARRTGLPASGDTPR